MQGRVHPQVAVPADCVAADKVAVMTQTLADVFAGAIAQHPEDWHMLQRLWLKDLVASSAPGRETRR